VFSLLETLVLPVELLALPEINLLLLTLDPSQAQTLFLLSLVLGLAQVALSTHKLLLQELALCPQLIWPIPAPALYLEPVWPVLMLPEPWLWYSTLDQAQQLLQPSTL